MIKARSARQHLTPAQRAQIIQDYHWAQLSQKEFAAQAGISVTTLQSWLRKAASANPAPRAKFLPVPNLLPAAAARSTYRLHLTGGMQLEVGSGFRPEELTTLLRIVREL
jgi:transposase-like protein